MVSLLEHTHDLLSTVATDTNASDVETYPQATIGRALSHFQTLFLLQAVNVREVIDNSLCGVFGVVCCVQVKWVLWWKFVDDFGCKQYVRPVRDHSEQ